MNEELIGNLLGAVASLEANVKELCAEVRGSKDDSCGRLDMLEHRVGKVEESLAILKSTVDELFQEIQSVSKFVHGLSCVEGDTCPDIPASLLPPSSRKSRASLASMSDDEPDSVLTREASLHAGPLAYRGPGVIVMIVLLIGLPIGIALMVLSHKYLGIP